MKNQFIFILVHTIIVGFLITSSSGKSYDITTVYEYFTKEFYINNDETEKQYLNNCSVSIYLSSNAMGLPIMYNKSIVQPINNPVIATFDANLNTTNGWLQFDNLTYALKENVIVINYTETPLFGRLSTEDLFKNILLAENSVSEFRTNEKKMVFSENELTKKPSLLSIKFKDFSYYSDRFQIQINLVSSTITIQITFTLPYYPSELAIMEMCYLYIFYPCQKINTASKQFYIRLDDNFQIYDSSRIMLYEKILPANENRTPYYKSITQIISLGQTTVDYQLLMPLQHVLSDDTTIVSPKLDLFNEIWFAIFYYKNSSEDTVHAFLNDEDNKMKLDLLREDEYSISDIQGEINSNFYITRFKIKFPEHQRTGRRLYVRANKNVFIKGIWQYESMITLDDIQTCDVDKMVIYNIALRDKQNSANVTYCINGGKLKDNYCACPPGFTGDYCETACSKNMHGQDCSNECSNSGECKGMVLCTPGYGCSCATGYKGEKCLETCSDGFYGAECKQKCGDCEGRCDTFTGYCTEGCNSPHLIWPFCKQSHSYFKDGPVIKSVSYNRIILTLNLTLNNIEKFLDQPMFYVVQYKEESSPYWNNDTLSVWNKGKTEYAIEDLKAGTKYQFRNILIDESLNTHNPILTKVSEKITPCNVSQIPEGLNVHTVTNVSIGLTWNEANNTNQQFECPGSSYTLEIQSLIIKRKSRVINGIKTNTVHVHFLRPETTYMVTLRKLTLFGESIVIAKKTITTEKTFEFLEINGLKAYKKPFGIKLQWIRSPFFTNYYIRYKLRQRLSCNFQNVSSPLKTIVTTLITYNLDLEPNCLYDIFVTVNKEQVLYPKYHLSVVTDSKTPETAPKMIEEIKVSNNSVEIYWDKTIADCEKIYGFFSHYSVEIIQEYNIGSSRTFETKSNKLKVDGLLPLTEYIGRIRYVNTIGSNPLFYLQLKFKTKSSSSLEPEEFVVYKTSQNTVGLRWKIPKTNSTLIGTTIKIGNNKKEKQFLNLTNIEELKCHAWSTYYCYSVTQLKHSTNYSFAINLLTEEYPQGGMHKPIYAITREGMPSSVSDIQIDNNIINSNITISWKIPFILNGILRKFLIEIEQVSSFDETLCCQSLVTLNCIVNEERERYNYTINDLQSASTYIITIRAFTKRLGPPVIKTIEIPPPIIPITNKPVITVNDILIRWKTINDSTDNIERSDLAHDELIIVQPHESYNIDNETTVYSTELNKVIGNTYWWLAHVCYINETLCSVDLGSGEEIESPYGKIINKPLENGKLYNVIVVQINKYLTTKSYTTLISEDILMKMDSIENENDDDKEIIDNTSTYRNSIEKKDAVENTPNNDMDDINSGNIKLLDSPENVDKSTMTHLDEKDYPVTEQEIPNEEYVETTDY